MFYSCLQNYLKELLSKPVLYNSLPVKRFLDPENYSCNFTGKETTVFEMSHEKICLRDFQPGST